MVAQRIFLGVKKVGLVDGYKMLSVLIVLLFCSFGHHYSYCQHYFKQVQNSDLFFRQRIAQFKAGDILVCDSSVEAQRTGTGGQITMTRLDECGNIVWAKAYNRTPEYLEFKDVKINEADEIFAYGSAYLGLNELIFLLKVDANGQLLQFRLFRPETVDHFSYAIELHDGQLILYGLLLDFGTQKQGFIAVFNQQLNFNWGKKFAPFDSDGNVMITQDGGFLCHSGAYFYKLDTQGNLIWAKKIDTSNGVKVLAGPLEARDGYIFQVYFDGRSTFCKWDDAGNLVWESQSFPSSAIEAALVVASNQNIVATYNVEENGISKLAYLILQPNGTIMEQQILTHQGEHLGVSSIYACISERDVVTIAGNKNAFQHETFNFLLQFPLFAPFEADCFQWNTYRDLTNRSLNLTLSPFDTVVVPMDLLKLDSENIARVDFEPPFRPFCAVDSTLTLVQFDTLLDCDKNWLVNLPPGFLWEDRNRDNPRLLLSKGTYRAINNRDCTVPIIYSYELERDACACNVYLPTAFARNSTNQNNTYSLYSNCAIAALEFAIYNRWGGKIYEHRATDLAWDGSINKQSIPPGVYLVKLVYELIDDAGMKQTGKIVQELVVL